MKKSDKYVKLVEWSEEDGCFIGSCPELLLGGCHGSDAKKVFADFVHFVLGNHICPITKPIGLVKLFPWSR